MSTFGSQTPGGVSHTVSANASFLNQKQATFTGIINSVGAYIKDAAVNEAFRIVVFDDDAGSPGTIIAMTPQLLGDGSDKWFLSDLATPLEVTNSSYYWIGVHCDNTISVTYNAGSEDWEYWNLDTYPLIDQPWGGPSSSGGSTEYALYFDTARLSTYGWIGRKCEYFKSNALDIYNGYIDPDEVVLMKVAAVEDLTLVKMWTYAGASFETGEYIRGVIYSDDAGTPDALLKQTDPLEGTSTQEWLSADLQSVLDITAGTVYWIGWQADGAMDYMASASGWIDSDTIYGVADTYSDGPEDPCNSPADYTDASGVAWYAEEGLEVDRQFGLQTMGASDQALVSDEHFVNYKQCDFHGIIYSISAYIKNAAVGDLFRLTIYTTSGTDPDILIAETPLLEGTGVDGWVTSELAQPIVVVKDSYYWLGVFTDDPITLTYDAGSEHSRIISDAWAAPIQPWVGGSNVPRNYAIYANTERITSTRRWIGFKQQFFKTDAGGFDSYGADADTVMLVQVTAIEDLTIERIWAYVKNTWTSSMYARAVVYSDSGGSPDALLAQSDPMPGASTEQWYSADLQSTLDITEGTTYWIGWQADSNSTVWMECPWGWGENVTYYTVADTYVGGPEDPCNSPADDTGWGEMGYYAEALEDAGGGGIDAQPGVFIDML